MAWVWTTVGAWGLVLPAVCFATAVPVYLSGPRRLQNRLLALLLFLFGLGTLAGAGLMYLTDEPTTTYAWQIASTVAQSAGVWIYLAFLSTLAAPLARPLVRLRPALYAAAALNAIAVVLLSEAYVVGVVPGAFSPWDVAVGPGFRVFSVEVALSGLVGIAVAASAVRNTTRGTVARAQALAYLAAFACFDVNSLSYLAYAVFGAWPVGLLYFQIALSIAFVLLLAYGVLKAQLFDIDLKVKWTIRRATVLGVFLAAFLVAVAIAEQYLERYGAVAGGAAVGLLLVAVRPIERAADRLADAAMPRVQDTQEYRTVRKREVYRAAVEGALEDGGVSDKERAMLARLAEQLGLGPVEMHAIEREATAARAGGATAGVA